jgi:hypothetical protein
MNLPMKMRTLQRRERRRKRKRKRKKMMMMERRKNEMMGFLCVPNCGTSLLGASRWSRDYGGQMKCLVQPTAAQQRAKNEQHSNEMSDPDQYAMRFYVAVKNKALS